MLVSLDRRLAYLALPKTGTTSIEKALEPLCDIRFGRSPRAKHMTMSSFERFVLPYLRQLGMDAVETVCVIREPVGLARKLVSLSRRGLAQELPKSTRGVSFAEFVEAYLAKPQPPFAKIGRPSRFVAGKGGTQG